MLCSSVCIVTHHKCRQRNAVDVLRQCNHLCLLELQQKDLTSATSLHVGVLIFRNSPSIAPTHPSMTPCEPIFFQVCCCLCNFHRSLRKFETQGFALICCLNAASVAVVAQTCFGNSCNISDVKPSTTRQPPNCAMHQASSTLVTPSWLGANLEIPVASG